MFTVNGNKTVEHLRAAEKDNSWVEREKKRTDLDQLVHPTVRKEQFYHTFAQFSGWFMSPMKVEVAGPAHHAERRPWLNQYRGKNRDRTGYWIDGRTPRAEPEHLSDGSTGGNSLEYKETVRSRSSGSSPDVTIDLTTSWNTKNSGLLKIATTKKLTDWEIRMQRKWMH